MSDATALGLIALLVLLAVAAYQGRETLQPNRGAAIAYIAAHVVWGVALLAVWLAWAGSPRVSICDDACDQVTESFDEPAAGLKGGVFNSPELP